MMKIVPRPARRPLEAPADLQADPPVASSPEAAEPREATSSDRVGRSLPSHTRFKPGQSGNPKGRPKGSKSFAEDVQRQMRKSAVVTIDGKPTRRTLQVLMAQRLAHDAAKGSLKAIELAAKLTGQASGADTSPVAQNKALTLDLEALRRIYERLGQRLAEDEDPEAEDMDPETK
jgi:hypothetical protein